MEIINQHYITYPHDLPSYEDFYENVMQKNIACLFNSNLTSDWLARKEWVINHQEQQAAINFDHLGRKYGSYLVPVYNCDEKYFNSNPQNQMKFDDFLNYWKNIIKSRSNQPPDSCSTMPNLYLKDWHLVQDSQDPTFYKLPIYFESDYLNQYCDDMRVNDYKFVYMGPKHSYTPLHIDVFGSYSWSANVVGTKKWLMIPADNVILLKKLIGSQTIPHDMYALPNHQEIIKQVDGFEIIQKTGETLFVPSGYMHQVINLEDTISINHNWFNACNIHSIYANLMEAFAEVENEMIDLKKDLHDDEWYSTCDRIMAIHFGMNLDIFYRIVRHVADHLNTVDGHDDLRPKFRVAKDNETVEQILEKLSNNDKCRKMIENAVKVLN